MLRVIADDLTGACDVGAELAMAGLTARVAVTGEATPTDAEDVLVVNTQSRALRPSSAYERVLRLLRNTPGELLLKKIDTALRGHLGAELDAALDGLGAPAAFILPAIPAAGRITRDGCQWFGGIPLGTTEFARDPEGPGPESSVAAVLARESRRRTEVISTGVLRAGKLGARAQRLIDAGTSFFVVDAETEDDLALAVAAILELPYPLCLAGSIALAAALAPHFRPAGVVAAATPLCVLAPALVVSGSLHTTARAQLDAALVQGLAVAVPVPAPSAGDAAHAGVVADACAHLHAGRSVVLAPAPPSGPPEAVALRTTERQLAELATAILSIQRVPTLVLVGGETGHAVLRRLGATALRLHGRFAPLVAGADVLDGVASGARLVTKGGSGGDATSLVSLLGNWTTGGAGAATLRSTTL